MFKIIGNVKLDKNKLFSIINSFRGISEGEVDDTDVILSDIKNAKHSDKMIYPCDVVELRNILRRELIENKIVSLFSIKFAEKYLKNYSIFIVLDINHLSLYEFQDCEGIIFFEDINELDIHDSIIRIIINSPISKDVINTINNIIMEEGMRIETFISNSVPGISYNNPKLSTMEGDKYIMKNWYKEVKISQCLDDANNIREKDEIVYPEKSISKYRIGMRVRDKRKGIAVPQEMGEITSISDNNIEVTWHDSKGRKKNKQIFSLKDTVAIAAILEEA